MRIESASSTIAVASVALHPVVDVGDELVAQVVEAGLADRDVGDVAGVRRAALLVGGRLGDPADGEAEQVVDRLHPLGVAAGQVVVDGEHVHRAVAEADVPVRGDRGGQRLALTGGHLGDLAGEQRHRAEQLHVVRPLAERRAGRPPGRPRRSPRSRPRPRRPPRSAPRRRARGAPPRALRCRAAASSAAPGRPSCPAAAGTGATCSSTAATHPWRRNGTRHRSRDGYRGHTVRTTWSSCRRRAARSSSSAGASSNGTTAVTRCLRIGLAVAAQQVDRLGREPLPVPGVRQPARHPADLRAAHRQAVVVELLAEPDLVGAGLVERQVDDRALRAQQAQRQVQRGGLPAALEHHVGAAVARPRAATRVLSATAGSSAVRVQRLAARAPRRPRGARGVGSSTTTDAAP